MNQTVQSVSVDIKPIDSRCRYWAKIVRAGVPLPLPSVVTGAAHVPGDFLRIGQDEMFPGDVLIEGEEKHHRVNRGWDYFVTYCTADGKQWGPFQPTVAMKVFAKQNGIAPNLLPGSGDLAACVRIGHALRAGIDLGK